MDLATKKKLLAAATTKLKKAYGDNVILDPEAKTNYKVISSGSMLFDQATGVGGIVLGKVYEIYGAEAVGKSTWCFSACAQAQKAYPDKMILYIDIEQAVNLQYLQSFGVDISPDKFIFCQPSSAEEALTIMEEYVNTSLFSLAIYDSVGASLTLDQLEKGIDQATMGSLAKKMSVGLNKLKNSANTTETALVFVNQVYDKIGTFSAYGTPTETKGGKALKYTASARIQLAKRDLIASEDNKEIISGQVLSFKFVKNKLGQPYQKGETILYFGKGFDEFSEVTDLAIKFDYIHRGGAWFSFKTKDGTDMKLQGKASVISYLTNTSEDFQYYKDLVMNHLKEGKIIEIDPSIADEDEDEE